MIKKLGNNLPGILDLFKSVADMKGAIWLDSSYRFGDRGRFSVVALNPVDDIIIGSYPDSFFRKMKVKH